MASIADLAELPSGAVSANLVVVPLIGWMLAELFVLDAPNYVALVMIACSPGAPFAAKLIMMQKGDLETGSALQVALAVVELGFEGPDVAP